MDTLDPEAFQKALQRMVTQLAENTQFLAVPTPEQLDKLAESISDTVSTVLIASTKRVCG
jgi:hypothetical protein